MSTATLGGRLPVLLLSLALAACGTSGGPQTGGLTNWMRTCEKDADCGDLSCVCGACTRPCRTQCADLPDASCVAADDAGAVALCGGDEPTSAGICLQTCEPGECPASTTCVAGVCSPLGEPNAHVTVVPSTQHQSLVGFGASLAYMEDNIVAHPSRAALYDAMFVDLGLDVVRLRNRYDGDPAELAAPSEILAAATNRLGRPPTTLMVSASPPAEVKANGSRECTGNPDTCTLATLADGTFDYAGMAAYWRESLDAYADAGVFPDYISIQNNPNWVPPASERPQEACRFLPTEGSTMVDVDNVTEEVTYPGYAEALAAVVDALDGLDSVPAIAAPSVTGFRQLSDYLPALDLAQIDAIAHHMYGTDPAAVDTAALEELGQLARENERPLFQTEMQADGFETAVLMHHVLNDEGAAVYLQNDIVGAPAPIGTLIALQSDSFTVQAPYHAMRHFAHRTDPGWVRVDASSDLETLLATAWLSPDRDALTMVFVNSATDAVTVQLDVDSTDNNPLDNSEVTRTSFDGVERSASLGELSAARILTLPGRAIVTVALWR